jgi:hypothetical protein
VTTWKEVEGIAKTAGAKYPELVAAQWALESAWGEATSGRHNYFGLKGKGSTVQTQEVVNGKTITIQAGFLNFNSLAECVQYLVNRWYKDFGSYKGVNNAVDRIRAANQLFNEGYATDPNYAQKLIALMDRHAPRQLTTSTPANSGPVLYQISAVAHTYLKKQIKQASDLKEEEKLFCPIARVWSVIARKEIPGDAHVQITLSHGAGTWYAYEPHWRKIQDPQRQEFSWRDFDSRITPYLTVGEVLQWDRRRTPLTGSSDIQRILETAAQHRIIREAWGSPIGVTSFYRPEPINREVGGVTNSYHVTGLAMDIYPVDRSIYAFYSWIQNRWTGGLGDGRNRGFIHLDRQGGGRFVAAGGVRPARTWIY